MPYINCVLIDLNQRLMCPAVMNLDDFSIQKISSTLDTIEFQSHTLGVYTTDYTKPFRTYQISTNAEGILTVSNAGAKKAITAWASQMPTDVGEKLLMHDEILKSQNTLAQAIDQAAKKSKTQKI